MQCGLLPPSPGCPHPRPHPVNPNPEVHRRTHPVAKTPLICVSVDGSGGMNPHIRDCKGVKASRQIIHGAAGIAVDDWIRRKINICGQEMTITSQCVTSSAFFSELDMQRPIINDNQSERSRLRLFPGIVRSISNYTRGGHDLASFA